MTSEVTLAAQVAQGEEPGDLLGECERFLKTIIGRNRDYSRTAYMSIPGHIMQRGAELLTVLESRSAD